MTLGNKVNSQISAELWAAARKCGCQVFRSGEPEYPGHDDEDGKVTYRALRMGSRLFLLSKDMSSGSNSPPHVCMTTVSGVDALEEWMRQDCYDGWSMQLATVKPSSMGLERFTRLLASEYVPIDGSGVNPRSLAFVMGLAETQRVGYIEIYNADARLWAVTGMRTGITTGLFVFDEPLEKLLKALGFSVSRVDAVVDSGCSREALIRLKDEALAQRREAIRAQLERELAQAEKTVRTLRASLGRH